MSGRTVKYHKKLTGMVVSIGTVRNTGINGKFRSIAKGRDAVWQECI